MSIFESYVAKIYNYNELNKKTDVKIKHYVCVQYLTRADVKFQLK